MKSLDYIEELNKILIEADKKCNIVYDLVGEADRKRTDIEHELLNSYKNLSAKEKREYSGNIYNALLERHTLKYEHRELEILKEFYNTAGVKKVFDITLEKLRKLNTEMDTPIYYYRAKENQGKKIYVNGNLQEKVE